MRYNKIVALIASLAIGGMLFSCAPKIYVIDRQSVFEQESAGEWPRFEQEIVGKSVATGPAPFAKVPITEKKARIYKVLNGELVATPQNQNSKKVQK